MVFLVVTYGCENWTIKKAEHRRIDDVGKDLRVLDCKKIKSDNSKGNQS